MTILYLARKQNHLIGDFVVYSMRLKKITLPILTFLLFFSRSATCAEENTITTVELLRQTAEQARGPAYWTENIKSSTEIEQLISWYVSALRCDYCRYSNSPLMDKKHWIRSLVDKGLGPSSRLYRPPLASSGVLTLRERLVAFSSEEAVRRVENLYESNGIPTIEPKPPTIRIRDIYADPSKLPAEIKPSHVGDFGPKPRRNQLAE